MRKFVFLFLIVASTVSAAERKYEVTKLTEGVYGFMWKEPFNNPEANSLIIINDDDVVVVDSSLMPTTSRKIVAEIKKLTNKPVRILVNTHWHDDHVFGNSVFREAWPGVQIVAHMNTRTDAENIGFNAIPQDIKNNDELIARFEKNLATGKADDGTELTDARKARVRDYLESLHEYSREVATVKKMLPDLTFDQSLILERGQRTIEVRYLGRGNTRGDIVVWLPNEKVLATGDLVVNPIPFGLGSYYSDWIATLDRMQQFDAQTIFLSHGRPQKDWTYVRKLRELLSAVVTRVGAEVAKGATLEETQKSVTLEDYKKDFAGDDALRQRAFDQFFVLPAVKRAYRQAKGDPDDPADLT